MLNYNENQDTTLNQITTNNIYLAVLNLAKFNEGNILHEANLKLRNNVITGDFKIAQHRQTFEWVPSAELKYHGN